MKDSLDEFTAVLQVLELFILFRALPAYNASSTNADEGPESGATLSKFGLPLRRVVTGGGPEGLLVGAAGTVLGAALGPVVVRWMATSILSFDHARPRCRQLDRDNRSPPPPSAWSRWTLAPLLTGAGLCRLDTPGTLRVVE